MEEAGEERVVGRFTGFVAEGEEASQKGERDGNSMEREEVRNEGEEVSHEEDGSDKEGDGGGTEGEFASEGKGLPQIAQKKRPART